MVQRHTIRKPASNITWQALTWKPQGKRKRGRPRNAWRRETEAAVQRSSHCWGKLERAAQSRVRWRSVVHGLCCSWSERPLDVSKRDAQHRFLATRFKGDQ